MKKQLFTKYEDIRNSMNHNQVIKELSSQYGLTPKRIEYWIKKHQSRYDKLMPSGIPRYLRVYDNGGKTIDRYTVVFTGRYRKSHLDEFMYVSANPGGVGVYLHDFSPNLIDRPTYSHLGKKIGFKDLDIELRLKIVQDYRDLWEV